MAGGRPISSLVLATGGLIAWAAQFTVIYGVASVACARGYAGVSVFGIGLVPLTILTATVLALAATVLVVMKAARDRKGMDERTHPTDRFINITTLLVGGLSLVTIVWHGLPALIVPACA